MERCVRAYRGGDDPEARARRIVEILSPRLSRLLSRQPIGRSEAEDLTQEIFFRVFQKIEEYRFQAPFGAWFRSIAVNTLLNHLRAGHTREQHLTEVPLEAPTADDEAPTVERPEVSEPARAETSLLRTEAERQVLEAIATLPPGMRHCLLLRVVHDLKYRQIAAILGVTLNSVRSQISHGYRRLGPILAPYFPELTDGED